MLNAYINGTLGQELETLDLNLPPGALQKAIKKQGMQNTVTEKDILKMIQQLMQQAAGGVLLVMAPPPSVVTPVPKMTSR